MRQKSFCHLVAHAHDGIERGHRLLEDHGHAEAAQLLQLVRRGRGQFAALQLNAAGDPCLWRQKAHDGQRGDAFTGAGFAHQGVGFARLQGKRKPAHGHQRRGVFAPGLTLAGELHAEVFDLQQHEGY